MTDTPPLFPAPPSKFSGKCQKIDPRASLDWLNQGWAFFAALPGVWLAVSLLMLAVLVGLALIPALGTPAALLLAPGFNAGLLYFCRQLATGRPPRPADLFVRLRRASGGLLALGAVGVLTLLIFGQLATGLSATSANPGVLVATWLATCILAGAFFLPLAMALWFAPALVLFNAMSAPEAMRASFSACAQNGLTFLAYGLLLLILGFLAALPLGLGIPLLIPIVCGSQFAAYRDAFPGT